MKKTDDFEDDGRTIADMSDVGGPSVSEALRGLGRNRGKKVPEEQSRPADPNLASEDELSSEERKWYIIGALRAALGIGAVYVAGLGGVILLLLLAWRLI